jgi:hypothetical protein
MVTSKLNGRSGRALQRRGCPSRLCPRARVVQLGRGSGTPNERREACLGGRLDAAYRPHAGGAGDRQRRGARRGLRYRASACDRASGCDSRVEALDLQDVGLRLDAAMQPATVKAGQSKLSTTDF